MTAERTIIHVDMDAFYASVEQRDDPSLRGKPVIVGGGGKRGVVAAASYEVRVFGVRSAMSMVEAMQRCPHAVVVPPRMSHYVEVSAHIFDIFRRYTPDVQGLSLDEAFLDVTGSLRLFGDGETIARRIRAEIQDELQLTASAGVAPSKFVAKIASDQDKPDGLTVVPSDLEGVRAFLAPLPINRMWGVGPKAGARLNAAGYYTIGQLAKASAERLEQLLGSWGPTVRELANGIDSRPVQTDVGAKSLGAEHTFHEDIRHREALLTPILQQCGRVAARLTRAGLYAQTITLKIKYADHTLRSRQMKLDEPARDTDTLYDTAKALLARFEHLERGVRLTGISASRLTEHAAPTLFSAETKGRREAIEALTVELAERFGSGTVKRARLVGKEQPSGYEGVSRDMVPVKRGDS